MVILMLIAMAVLVLTQILISSLGSSPMVLVRHCCWCSGELGGVGAGALVRGGEGGGEVGGALVRWCAGMRLVVLW